ncbi:hypothetical protein K4K49_007104 [Colletotrichum sp. SAR 10_70]|nr:hypothetical protein K4K50_007028 [Colletotrichum sp. SAR 10_71]KAI8161104.1 hypothetical protein K4K49_007104 [Colletotrichum sp. SAR 10_70]KAI8222947.1 hypothetical protein K4K54_006478 [Colletotrichum sp. SAR 10_86]KAI8223580.1 hypothetical protein K4K53_006794 [Colletotrichum sp. SAR 10_77]
MPITSVSASLPLETEETIRACLEVALRLSSDDVFAAADRIEKYRLQPAAFAVLLRRLETDPRISLPRLHLENRPRANLVSFDMPQSPLDPIVARLFSNTASSVAGDIIPKVQQFRNHFVSLPPPYSDPDSCEYGSVRRYTDVAWYADAENSTDFPRVVSTISSTQSSSFEELQKKCTRFVSLSEIHIGAIVAMKIRLDLKDPNNLVERPLYECRVALHVWTVGNADFTGPLDSTPNTMLDESISGRPWHFAKYILGDRYVAMPSSSQSRRPLLPKITASQWGARPDYIRVRFGDIEDLLKKAIQAADPVPSL